MTITVRPSISFSIAACTSRSFSASKEEVASSRMRMGASCVVVRGSRGG